MFQWFFHRLFMRNTTHNCSSLGCCQSLGVLFNTPRPVAGKFLLGCKPRTSYSHAGVYRILKKNISLDLEYVWTFILYLIQGDYSCTGFYRYVYQQGIDLANYFYTSYQYHGNSWSLTKASNFRAHPWQRVLIPQSLSKMGPQVTMGFNTKMVYWLGWFGVPPSLKKPPPVDVLKCCSIAQFSRRTPLSFGTWRLGSAAGQCVYQHDPTGSEQMGYTPNISMKNAWCPAWLSPLSPRLIIRFLSLFPIHRAYAEWVFRLTNGSAEAVQCAEYPIFVSRRTLWLWGGRLGFDRDLYIRFSRCSP